MRVHDGCTDSKVGTIVPRALGEVVYGSEVGEVLHFNYLSMGESDEMEVGGLVEGVDDILIVLMDELIRFVCLEPKLSCSGEVSKRMHL